MVVSEYIRAWDLIRGYYIGCELRCQLNFGEVRGFGFMGFYRPRVLGFMNLR